VEADLQRWYRVDYNDRTVPDEFGRPKLTLRRIGVLIAHLPENSAVSMALGGSGWTLEDYLLAHIFQALTGTQHPALPKQSKDEDPRRKAKRADALERSRERERALAAGEIA